MLVKRSNWISRQHDRGTWQREKWLERKTTESNYCSYVNVRYQTICSVKNSRDISLTYSMSENGKFFTRAETFLKLELKSGFAAQSHHAVNRAYSNFPRFWYISLSGFNDFEWQTFSISTECYLIQRTLASSCMYAWHIIQWPYIMTQRKIWHPRFF